MKFTVTVTNGSSTVIVCNITLNTGVGPDLSVLNYTWYYNNMDITSRSEILELNKDTNTVTTILNITSVQLSDTGDYECCAGIIGNNLMKSAFTKLCVQGIFVFSLFCLFNIILSVVAETKFPTQQNFTDLLLGDQLIVSCITESLYPEVSISWVDSNGLYYSTNNNTLVIPSLQPSHNNTIYTCVISIQGNHSGCQSREIIVREKCEI